MLKNEYVLITPAKNEEAFIEKTLESVIKQTILPRRWVIVSDGSTDRTDEIVNHYAGCHRFIHFLRRDSGKHSFGSKVHAFRAGQNELKDVSYEFIGNVDADIELPGDYYERLLERLADNPKLGLTGGTRVDLVGEEFSPIRFNRLDIGGAYQFFRRSCFEEIGGYLPLEFGGEDSIAGVMARQRGWDVQGFSDLVSKHYRPTGSAQGGVMKKGYRAGKQRFQMGYHPLFELVRLMRVSNIRQLVHNLSELTGFLFASLRPTQRQVPQAVVGYLQAEQLGRLKQFLLRFHDPAASSPRHFQLTERGAIRKLD